MAKINQPYPPQPNAQPYPPQQPVEVTATVQAYNVDVYQEQRFYARPQQAFCPKCRQNVMTRINYELGTFAWILFIVLFIFGFWACLCFIPICLHDCHDVEHECRQCGSYLGRYSRM